MNRAVLEQRDSPLAYKAQVRPSAEVCVFFWGGYQPQVDLTPRSMTSISDLDAFNNILTSPRSPGMVGVGGGGRGGGFPVCKGMAGHPLKERGDRGGGGP